MYNSEHIGQHASHSSLPVVEPGGAILDEKSTIYLFSSKKICRTESILFGCRIASDCIDERNIKCCASGEFSIVDCMRNCFKYSN